MADVQRAVRGEVQFEREVRGECEARSLGSGDLGSGFPPRSQRCRFALEFNFPLPSRCTPATQVSRKEAQNTCPRIMHQNKFEWYLIELERENGNYLCQVFITKFVNVLSL